MRPRHGRGWRVWLRDASAQFWFIPALMSVAGYVLAELGIRLERDGHVPRGLRFIYDGGEEGGRTLLSAISAITIGVAGTVFSITIAALSYSAGVMGPRLLRNFTRDRGNQVTLGIFIGTFTFALFSLRAVRSAEEGGSFVPHYNVTLALAFSVACIAALVYYLSHITATINTTSVVNFLCRDMRNSLLQATERRDLDPDGVTPPTDEFWHLGQPIRLTSNGGYVQTIDYDFLLDVAVRHDLVLDITLRPGDYAYPHSIVAVGVPDAPAEVLKAFAIGDQRTIEQDLEFAVRQLSEMAVRALSPAINDPITAIDVLDRFGDALCTLEDRRWPDGIMTAGGVVRVVAPVTSFGGLTDSMFHMIRQYGHTAPAVATKMMDVLTVSASCLTDDERHGHLRRHADLLMADARVGIVNASDLADVEHRYARFCQVVDDEHHGDWTVPQRG